MPRKKVRSTSGTRSTQRVTRPGLPGNRAGGAQSTTVTGTRPRPGTLSGGASVINLRGKSNARKKKAARKRPLARLSTARRASPARSRGRR